ncbi:MAG: T9SS type A sorting domain-containing protein [Flavobacteriales bacterium]|nr:MAG: T9SS type A sorting domain-containing protein [Flavobacteriales bacterium]
MQDQPSTNQVTYNRHTLNGTDRFSPAYRTPLVLDDIDVNVTWQDKSTACPTRLSEDDTKEERRMASQSADDEKQDAEAAYDATKDNGDTYTLLSYVNDGSKSSSQVRSALQSVAPKVSEEVWTAAFDRNPAMSQLHLTQALLSNSPLQPQALKLMDNSGMSAYYKQLVWNAQDGTANILTRESPQFTHLRSGCFASNTNGLTVRVNGAYFAACGHGLGIVGASPAHVTACDWKEPDLDMVGQGLGGPVYGTFLEETPVILFENNTFWTEGLNYDYACVGSTFLNTGAASNTFNNNWYDEFNCVNCTANESVGVTIQGDNSNLTPGSGLKFKCNRFSSVYANAYDMAFTGGDVTVDPQQGTAGLPELQAGNTFANSCTGDQHMWNDGLPNPINTFAYWHHDPLSTTYTIVPTCLTTPLTNAINQNATTDYNDGCGGGQNMMMSTSTNQANAAASAASEHALLKAVYEDWTDGGNTDGLEDYVQNGAHSSYDVRNQLMLVAPKVSSKVWGLVFERNPAMNPWHLAQALIANSPLEPEVLAMMDQSGLNAYYRQLVNNEQDGISMHSIYQSELGYWLGEQSKAVFAYSGSAFDETPPVTFAEAIALHQQYPVPGSAEELVRLHAANSDVTSARALVNDQLAAPHSTWWDVQDLWLAHIEAGFEPSDVDAALLAQLQTYAGASDLGAGLAKGWLAALGEPFEANIILPTESRAPEQPSSADEAVAPLSMLGVYPNPTRGEAFITYNLPEGVEDAEVVVTDAIGRLVWSRTTGRSSGVMDLPRAAIVPGLYNVVLYAGGVRIHGLNFTAVE